MQVQVLVVVMVVVVTPGHSASSRPVWLPRAPLRPVAALVACQRLPQCACGCAPRLHASRRWPPSEACSRLARCPPSALPRARARARGRERVPGATRARVGRQGPRSEARSFPRSPVAMPQLSELWQLTSGRRVGAVVAMVRGAAAAEQCNGCWACAALSPIGPRWPVARGTWRCGHSEWVGSGSGWATDLTRLFPNPRRQPDHRMGPPCPPQGPSGLAHRAMHNIAE